MYICSTGTLTVRYVLNLFLSVQINSSLSSNKSLGDMPSIDDESGSDDEALRTRSARGKDFEVDSIQLHIERQQQARAQVEFAKRR